MNEKSIILVFIGKLSKYAQFSALARQFTTIIIAKTFIIDICKLYGIPKTMVSDRDPIFMSSFWTELFRLIGTILSHNSAYHPQTDGRQR